MAPIPLFCKNYGLSLISKCDVNTFTKATVLCNVPYTFVWAVTGASGESLAEVIHGTASGEGSLRDSVLLGMKVALTLVRRGVL